MDPVVFRSQMLRRSGAQGLWLLAHTSGAAAQRGPIACFAAEPAAQHEEQDEVGNEKVRRLAHDILQLSLLEASWLSDILKKKLNIQTPAFGAMPFPAQPGGAQAAVGVADEAEQPTKQEEKKEKTEFSVLLEGFSAEGKIKVIKEIRAITNLGLKEAKELVEKAPVSVKSGITKVEAEALQKQLEAVGAKVKID